MRPTVASPKATLRILADRWPGAIDGDPGAVHAVRVSTRRLREALRLVERRSGGGRKVRRGLKRLTRALGPVREIDVSVALVNAIAEQRPDLAVACRRVSDRLIAIGVLRRSRLAKSLHGLHFDTLKARLRRHLRAKRGRHAPAADPGTVAARVAARAEDAGAHAESAGGLYAPEALHDVRIAVKKLRYALEMARQLRMPGAASAATRLRRHQDRLGDLHDLQVLSSHVGRLQARLPVEDADLRELSDLFSYVEDRCRELHAAFVSRRKGLVALCAELSSTFRHLDAVADRP